MKRSVPAFEKRLRGDSLGAGPIDEFIVEKNRTVACRKVATCLHQMVLQVRIPVPYDYPDCL
jgi:hypothetical protein